MSETPLPRWLDERLPARTPRTLTAWIGIALAVGLPLGLLAHRSETLLLLMTPLVAIGAIFVGCLKTLIIPIIVTSLAVGVANVGDTARLGRLGAGAATYYLGTTALAALLGLGLVNLIKPGVGTDLSEGDYSMPDKALPGEGMGVGDMLMDIFGNTLLHPVESAASGDIITIIVLTLLGSVGLLLVGAPARPIVRGLQWGEGLVMAVVKNVMWLAPPAVVGLLVASLGEHGIGLLVGLGKYCLTVLLALGIHGFLVLPLIVLLFARRSPVKWLRGIRPAMAVAFSTASSSATLPVTIATCENNLDVPKPIASFVLPLGATMNMDGTALYEAIAALFVAQALGMDLSSGQQVIVLITAMAASVGAAGIPSAGIVTMVMVFESVGLPLWPLGAIYAVDRVLDMCRTVVNVMGDTAGSVVLTRQMGGEVR
jgi:Na+/H+-dicarboxylate symporter